jgi:peptide chain release factor 1
MEMLRSKLYEIELEKRVGDVASQRKSLVSTGDRSAKIRTYNYPQGRITDHRINLTLYKIEAITDGDMEELINALSNEHQADLLAGFAED